MGGGRGAGVECMTISPQRLDPLAVRDTPNKRNELSDFSGLNLFVTNNEIAGHAL